MVDSTCLLHHGSNLPISSTPAPEDAAGFLSRCTFWWSLPTIKQARDRGHLEEEDLPRVPATDEPAKIFESFTQCWSQRLRTSGRRSSFALTVLWVAQRRLFASTVLHTWIGQLCATADPLVLRALLDCVNNGTDYFVQALLLVCLQTASLLCRVVVSQRAWHLSVRTTNNARSASVHAVFRRALLAEADSERDVGILMNFMATDADKFGKSDGLVTMLAQWAWALGSLPVVVFFLVQLVGVGAVAAAVAVIVAGTYSNRWLLKWTQPATQQVQATRDERSRLISELVRGMRTVKLQVWEDAWYARINTVREQEMRLLAKVQVLNALNNFLGSIQSLAMPAAVFAWIVLVDGRTLDSTTAFVTLSWLSMLRSALLSLPVAFVLYANLAPSMHRLGHFLLPQEAGDGDGPGSGGASSAEVLAQWSRELGSMQRFQPSCVDVDRPPVTLQGAALGYCSSSRGVGGLTGDGEDVMVVSAMDLEVRQGEFVIVAGPVGSGKSTVLAAVAGAQQLLSGLRAAHGLRFAYASQKPFLLNATLRDNITFTLPFDADRYQDAIQRVALGPDLQALAKGDETQVGESGVQMSGGQKARIALARVLYADVDVAVCDDVLSAVDAHTAEHLWKEAIVGGLLAQGRSLILATHRVQYLSRPEVSRVIMLQHGSVLLQGPWQALQQAESSALANAWEQTGQAPDPVAAQEPADAVLTTTTSGSQCHMASAAASTRGTLHSVALELDEVQRTLENVLEAHQGRRVTRRLIEDMVNSLRGRASEERTQHGLIAWADLRVYLRAFGSVPKTALLVASAMCAAGLSVAGNVWVSVWSSSSSPEEQHSGLAIYLGLGLAAGVCSAAQSLALMFCALSASRSLHATILRRLLGTPMSFFDNVSTGSILNRFLQDMDSIDSTVPNSIMDQLNKTLAIVTQLGIIYSQAPWVLLSLPVMIPPYVEVFRYVRVSNRDCKRFEASGHGPVYAHFRECLAGKGTIRAFGLEAAFVRRNLELVYSMAAGKYGNQAVGKWAQATLSQWSCVLYLFSGVACAIASSRGQMTGAQVGLVLLYAATLNEALMNYTVGCAVLESQFVSVERTAAYTRLQQEECLGDSSHVAAAATVLPSLPASNSVSFRNVHLRYAPHLLPALRGIDLVVTSGSKVALCGRTGCGKSSLLSVLARLYPTNAGEIRLGVHDVAALPLRVLRRALRVVSQDAFLMSGSIYENLVPSSAAAFARQNVGAFNELCWRVLILVGMSGRIASAGGLDCLVEDGGANFSVGERQLLTLARALMPEDPVVAVEWQPPPVLLADEATASVDLDADARVHDVLLGLSSTLVMVCHRLQYIQRFDEVAVLEEGRVAECASPATLIGTKDSKLRALCEEAGVL